MSFIAIKPSKSVSHSMSIIAIKPSISVSLILSVNICIIQYECHINEQSMIPMALLLILYDTNIDGLLYFYDTHTLLLSCFIALIL